MTDHVCLGVEHQSILFFTYQLTAKKGQIHSLLLAFIWASIMECVDGSVYCHIKYKASYCVK